jgi:hypothetical protein
MTVSRAKVFMAGDVSGRESGVDVSFLPPNTRRGGIFPQRV